MAEQNHLFPPNRPKRALVPPKVALPLRHVDVDKFGCGRVVVIGGSAGMAGAPALSAMAALRSGAGLVELHVPESVLAIAASFHPCVMTRGQAAGEAGCFSVAAIDPLLQRAARSEVVACGPGLGRTPATIALVQQLWRECPAVGVFDADALWALAQLERGTLTDHAGPRLLTPHRGELLRFLRNSEAAQASSDTLPPRTALEAEAAELAAALEAVVVLKGPHSLITDGQRRVHNTSGNPGMATAGSGDVLTGVVAALCGHQLEVFAAAQLGVWVHGHAGDVAAGHLSQTSVVATDLIDHLPAVFLTLEQMKDDVQPPTEPSG